MSPPALTTIVTVIRGLLLGGDRRLQSLNLTNHKPGSTIYTPGVVCNRIQGRLSFVGGSVVGSSPWHWVINGYFSGRNDCCASRILPGQGVGFSFDCLLSVCIEIAIKMGFYCIHYINYLFMYFTHITYYCR